METDFAKVTTDASGLAADMVRVRSERAEAWEITVPMERQNGWDGDSRGERDGSWMFICGT